MKHFFSVVLYFLLLSAMAAHAQSKADEQTVGKLPQGIKTPIAIPGTSPGS